MPNLAWDLIGRDISASKALNDVANSADRAGKSGEHCGHLMKTGLGVATGALAGAGLIAGLKDVVTASSNAEQSIGGVQAVFKGYANSVISDSKAADRALGLSANAYRELSTVIGSQLKNAGLPLEQLG